METGTRSGKHSFSIEHILAKPDKLQHQQSRHQQPTAGRPDVVDELMLDSSAFVSVAQLSGPPASGYGLRAGALNQHQQQHLMQHHAQHPAFSARDFGAAAASSAEAMRYSAASGDQLMAMRLDGCATPDSSSSGRLDRGEANDGDGGAGGAATGGCHSDDGDSVSDADGAECEFWGK